jgi:hypothetical protein
MPFLNKFNRIYNLDEIPTHSIRLHATKKKKDILIV